MPDFVNSGIVEKAREEVFKKKGIGLIREIKFEKIKEGKCVQILHTGPYSTEPESLEKEWSERDEEFVKRAGFALMAWLAFKDRYAENEQFEKFLLIIKREAADNRNFVKKAVN
ncbi:MAG: DNA alkylation repair protein [Candidatus Jordarchaeum sp.]|uniref:DNA alkylation repair protein n=1 Tax=Candidatus Jordarchaeum sp. TaxID=2823881 RepID=UPI00404B1D9B